MSDDQEDLVLRMLQDIRMLVGRIAEDRRLELQAFTGVTRRIDQVDARLERLERRAGQLRRLNTTARWPSPSPR